MEGVAMLIRPAQVKDAEAIAAIFNYEVDHGLSHYGDTRQTIEERSEWIVRLRHGEYPVLVAEEGARVVGFAALTPFHPLSGYRFTVTGSIYVDASIRGAGVGRALASALFAAAKERGYHSILAGVNSENKASITLLKSFGFEQVGYFKEIGFKAGAWRDDVCLQLVFPGEG